MVFAVVGRFIAVGRQLGEASMRSFPGAQCLGTNRRRCAVIAQSVASSEKGSRLHRTTDAAMLMRTPLPLEHFVVVDRARPHRWLHLAYPWTHAL